MASHMYTQRWCSLSSAQKKGPPCSRTDLPSRRRLSGMPCRCHAPDKPATDLPARPGCRPQLLQKAPSRRQLLAEVMGISTLLGLDRWLQPAPAQAALLQFPASRLQNRYYLVRAGESVAEASGRILTNPVAKTSMDSGLSAIGKRQVVQETADALRRMGACSGSCWIWPSITQRAYQTGEILGSLLGVGRSRLVPEYSFLDPRGLGALEGRRTDDALAAVYEGDSLGPDWRPPRGTDGTPNESVADVLVRMRQLLSICETQYSNGSVIIISPDSDNLSVLQAALLGMDLRRHTEFAFRPGEARAALLSPEAQADVQSFRFRCRNPPNCT